MLVKIMLNFVLDLSLLFILHLFILGKQIAKWNFHLYALLLFSELQIK